MKLIKKLSTLVVLSSVSGLGLAAGLGTDVTVNIKGKVIDASCEVTSPATAKLRTVGQSAITNITDMQGVTKFKLVLTNCGNNEVDIDIGKVKGGSVDVNGNLANTDTGGAKDVSVKVQVAPLSTGAATEPADADYKDINFETKKIDGQDKLATKANTNNNQIMNGVYFRAGYVLKAAGATVAPGDVITSFTVGLDYN